MLLHHMALFSVRLFCKNLGNLQEFFWANGLPPPLAKNCPYAYVSTMAFNVFHKNAAFKTSFCGQ